VHSLWASTLDIQDSALEKYYHIGMRRLVYIAAFALAVSLGTASAQMRGGGMGRGGIGRSGGAVASRGFVGGRIAPHPGGLPRASFTPRFAPRFGPRFAPRNSIQLRIGGFNPRFGGRFGFNRGIGFRHRRGFFGNGFFGNQVVYVGGWPYYGWWGDPFYDSSYYETSAQNNEEYRAQQQLNNELQDLRYEVRTLREENDEARYEARNAERQPPAAPQRSGEAPPETPATVLVFRDGHKVETRNYAIAGKTLWLFDEHRATKLPVSDLDLEATTKADEQRGIDFRLPRK